MGPLLKKIALPKRGSLSLPLRSLVAAGVTALPSLEGHQEVGSEQPKAKQRGTRVQKPLSSPCSSLFALAFLVFPRLFFTASTFVSYLKPTLGFPCHLSRHTSPGLRPGFRQVRIRLGKLAHFAAHFVGSAKFQDVPFELRLGVRHSPVARAAGCGASGSVEFISGGAIVLSFLGGEGGFCFCFLLLLFFFWGGWGVVVFFVFPGFVQDVYVLLLVFPTVACSGS